jgi:hypothetical protein
MSVSDTGARYETRALLRLGVSRRVYASVSDIDATPMITLNYVNLSNYYPCWCPVSVYVSMLHSRRVFDTGTCLIGQMSVLHRFSPLFEFVIKCMSAIIHLYYVLYHYGFSRFMVRHHDFVKATKCNYYGD